MSASKKTINSLIAELDKAFRQNLIHDYFHHADSYPHAHIQIHCKAQTTAQIQKKLIEHIKTNYSGILTISLMPNDKSRIYIEYLEPIIYDHEVS